MAQVKQRIYAHLTQLQSIHWSLLTSASEDQRNEDKHARDRSGHSARDAPDWPTPIMAFIVIDVSNNARLYGIHIKLEAPGTRSRG